MNVGTVEAQIEAAEVGYWFHITDPLGNWSVHELLVDGLQAVKADHREAVRRHDHALAGKLMVEITDLTALCAASADGLASQRSRFLHSDRPWPLA